MYSDLNDVGSFYINYCFYIPVLEGNIPCSIFPFNLFPFLNSKRWKRNYLISLIQVKNVVEKLTFYLLLFHVHFIFIVS